MTPFRKWLRTVLAKLAEDWRNMIELFSIIHSQTFGLVDLDSLLALLSVVLPIGVRR